MREKQPKSSCSSPNQLEIELMHAGKKLLRFSYITAVIHDVLAKLKEDLSKVEQKPSESMKKALHPVIEALVAKKLVRHADLDVNISVACCFCEILRINAPDSPCNDEQLKDFFEMTVNTFEKLSSASGGSYVKMGRVLNIFSRTRLPVLMLDLQLDGVQLIVRLFKQFLTVADSNPSAIVLEMEKIMSMIIEESTELKPELVGLLVEFSKNKHKSASHDRWGLGEKVLMSFAARFKPHFADMGRDALYDYCISVASSCKPKIKTEWQEIVTRCQHEEQTNSFYAPPSSVTEVNGIHKRNNNPLEIQVSSSQGGTVCVQGYQVKESNADILEAVFRKHGDITADCIFETRFMRSSILEAVCEVVRRIQTNEVVEKMEDTERLVSDAEAVHVDVAWLRPHLEAIRKKTECLERSNKLRETRKHALLVEAGVRKDLIETSAEVVAALERVGQTERLVNVLTVFEKNLDEKLLECKAELDSLDSWI
ncbi:putative sister chromatid cohesion protein Pds5 [Helianthus debilis subsp. tardiflorus]